MSHRLQLINDDRFSELYYHKMVGDCSALNVGRVYGHPDAYPVLAGHLLNYYFRNDGSFKYVFTCDKCGNTYSFLRYLAEAGEMEIQEIEVNGWHNNEHYIFVLELTERGYRRCSVTDKRIVKEPFQISYEDIKAGLTIYPTARTSKNDGFWATTKLSLPKGSFL